MKKKNKQENLYVVVRSRDRQRFLISDNDGEDIFKTIKKAQKEAEKDAKDLDYTDEKVEYTVYKLQEKSRTGAITTPRLTGWENKNEAKE